MKKLLLSAIICLAPSLSLADFDPEFGMRMGYEYNDLSIDAALTKENGAASQEDPQLYLNYDDNGEFWIMPSVIASPSAGVCGLGYYSRASTVEEKHLAVAVQEVLNSHIKPMTSRYGEHFMKVGDGTSPISLDHAVTALEKEGAFSLMSPAPNRQDVLSSIVEVRYTGDLLEVAGGLMYSNITECIKEIYNVE